MQLKVINILTKSRIPFISTCSLKQLYKGSNWRRWQDYWDTILPQPTPFLFKSVKQHHFYKFMVAKSLHLKPAFFALQKYFPSSFFSFIEQSQHK